MKFTQAFGAQMFKLGMEGYNDLVIIPCSSSVGAFWARNKCLLTMRGVEQELKKRYDWTVWFDSDMLYPDRTIQALIRHNKDIVGATYRRRSPPYELLGKPKEGTSGTAVVGTLAPASRLPTGVMLVRRKVFDDLPQPVWRVDVGTGDGVNGVTGEDSMFCDAAIAAGYEVWLDTALTTMIAHVGEMELKADVEDVSPSPIILTKPSLVRAGHA